MSTHAIFHRGADVRGGKCPAPKFLVCTYIKRYRDKNFKFFFLFIYFPTSFGFTNFHRDIHTQIRGRSRISVKGVSMYKGTGGLLCRFYLIFLKYNMKMKIGDGKGKRVQANPLWIDQCK